MTESEYCMRVFDNQIDHFYIVHFTLALDSFINLSLYLQFKVKVEVFKKEKKFNKNYF